RQELGPQSMFVDRFNHRLQGERVPPGKFLQLFVERVLEEVVVEVSHQVEMTLLLVAGDRIIRRVEVRHEDASEVMDRFLEESALPSRMIQVDDDLRARERPDVAKDRMLELHLGLVGMDEHPGSQMFQHPIHSHSVRLSQASLGTQSDLVAEAVSEYVVHA